MTYTNFLVPIAERINDWMTPKRLTYIVYTMWVLGILSAFLLWFFNAPLFWLSLGVLLVLHPDVLTFPLSASANRTNTKTKTRMMTTGDEKEEEKEKTETKLSLDFARSFNFLIAALGLWLISISWKGVFL